MSFHSHPIIRMDFCAYGVLLASFICRDRDRVKAILVPVSRSATLILCLVPICLLGVIFYILTQFDPDLEQLIHFRKWEAFYFTFNYTLIDGTTAVIVAVFYFLPPRLPPLVQRFVTGMSKTSYSLYLLHMLVNGVFISTVVPVIGLGPASLAYIVTLSLGSVLSYRVIEKPFLTLRDRWLKT